MLEKYCKALEPDSLLEVVPKEILQSLMQSFFFGHRAGMFLIYDEGKGADGQPILKRLEPVDTDPQDWRAIFQNFNPFCAKFREKPERNAMCEACDLKHAHAEFVGTKRERRYTCHMGLVDMTIPIKIGGKIRAVVSAGQKILREDQKMVANIRERIREKAPDIAQELEAALKVSAQDAKTVETFEGSFVKFAETFQITVEAFIRAKREEAGREALLEINEELARTLADNVNGWTRSTAKLFLEIESFVGGKPVWMLQRRGSRYQCLAASPLGAEAVGVTIPVLVLITLPVEKVEGVEPGSRLHGELTEKLSFSGQDLSLVRIDTPIAGADVTSLVVILGTRLVTELEPFVVAFCRALAYPAGVAGLFRRLEKQQNDFARAASFTGHHLKTPLQAALFSMREAVLVVGDSPSHHAERQALVQEAEEQVSQGLADALRLQAAALPPLRERFSLHLMLEALVEDMRPLARNRGIQIQVTAPADFKCEVSGIPFQIRIALFNLLDNAIKYSFESKRIDIRVYRLTVASDSRKPLQDNVCVEIEDVGVGFPSEHKEHLFGMGRRLEESAGSWARGGVGIGLLQAKEYIEAAGGSLDINSEALPTRTDSISKVQAIIHLPIVL